MSGTIAKPTMAAEKYYSDLRRIRASRGEVETAVTVDVGIVSPRRFFRLMLRGL